MESSGRTPIVQTDKEPVISKTMMEMKDVESTDLPDIFNMTVGEIKALDLDPVMAKKLLDMEKNGRKRIRVIEYLEK
jgi:hypothetical protein